MADACTTLPYFKLIYTQVRLLKDEHYLKLSFLEIIAGCVALDGIMAGFFLVGHLAILFNGPPKPEGLLDR